MFVHDFVRSFTTDCSFFRANDQPQPPSNRSQSEKPTKLFLAKVEVLQVPQTTPGFRPADDRLTFPLIIGPCSGLGTIAADAYGPSDYAFFFCGDRVIVISWRRRRTTKVSPRNSALVLWFSSSRGVTVELVVDQCGILIVRLWGVLLVTDSRWLPFLRNWVLLIMLICDGYPKLSSFFLGEMAAVHPPAEAPS